MGKYLDTDKLDYTRVSIYWGDDSEGRAVYRDCFVAFRSDIEALHTVDVVPKSEAEALEEEIKRLQSILNNYALRYGTVRDQRAVIDNAKAEVAKEIFAEIERTCVDTFGNFYVGATHGAFAELKKKYTEGGGTE